MLLCPRPAPPPKTRPCATIHRPSPESHTVNMGRCGFGLTGPARRHSTPQERCWWRDKASTCLSAPDVGSVLLRAGAPSPGLSHSVSACQVESPGYPPSGAAASSGGDPVPRSVAQGRTLRGRPRRVGPQPSRASIWAPALTRSWRGVIRGAGLLPSSSLPVARHPIARRLLATWSARSRQGGYRCLPAPEWAWCQTVQLRTFENAQSCRRCKWRGPACAYEFVRLRPDEICAGTQER